MGLVFLMTSLCNTGFCQAYSNEPTPGYRRVADTYRLYKDTIAGASLLYSGAEYGGIYRGVVGSPFFETSDFVNGSLSYNGVRYNNIPLKYDLVTDELVTKGFHNESISLVREKIDSFRVLNHIFIRLVNDSLRANASLQRFYDLLYDGKNITFLTTRQKVIKHALHAEDPSSFVTYTTYYVLIKDLLYSIANKKALIRLLGGRRGVMKAFWKNNNVSFKNDAELSIGKAVEYYDQLKREL